jgi:hypothetical protein
MKKYTIGIMYSGVRGNNGADFVAQFLINAAVAEGHNVTPIGTMGGFQVQDIPDKLDFVIHSSGYGLTPELVEKFKKKTKLFLWTHNDELLLWQSIIGKITNLVDAHFIYTVDEYYGNHTIYLPLGADNTIYYPLYNSEKKYDICMIGARRGWRELFLDKISKVFPKSYYHLNMQLTHAEINKLYNETKIVLAPIQDCDNDSPGAAWGCPCRTFDVPASGAFQLHVNRGGLFQVYPTAITINPIQNIDTAVQEWTTNIQYWLDSEEERKAKADELYEITMESHLYKHRLKTIIEHYEIKYG